jgi:hypothetical protein
MESHATGMTFVVGELVESSFVSAREIPFIHHVFSYSKVNMDIVVRMKLIVTIGRFGL